MHGGFHLELEIIASHGYAGWLRTEAELEPTLHEPSPSSQRAAGVASTGDNALARLGRR
ncbi:hypothetical protein [Martelella alba]|uniref:hypothetical protein n=1 Tax=Martelella alba TaxID=2590451 RepID=UPI0015E86EAB|nr:hypothetical protein [Martelella alba]